ncbi:sensor histidine kinase [Paenibacillus sp. FSL W7-1287]|uniref:sensor histidine kinase n=1 Tax=Paenibacillus sp. FSL W7-1287 TaxID=2954538 RepID=UPI0030FA57E1
MKRWIDQSLRQKLTILMILSTIFPILLLGIYSFYISLQGNRQNIDQTGNDILNQMEASLKYQLQDIERTSIFLIGLQEIQAYANSTSPTGQQQSVVLSILTNLVSSKDHIFDISLYTKGSPDVISTSSLYSSDLSNHLDISSVNKKVWSNPYAVVNYAGEHRIITFARPLRSINNYETLGWISISVNEQQLIDSLLHFRLDGKQGDMYILNEHNIIIAASQKDRLTEAMGHYYPLLVKDAREKAEFHKGVNRYSYEGTRHVMLYSPNFYEQWSIIGMYPHDIYRAESSSILKFAIITVVISIMITGFLILFTVRHITNPLRLLTRLLSKINPDEPMPVYHSRSNDEIGELAKSYSRLSKHIEQLKKKVVRIEVRKKEADMRALQSQINPHFLYNTLSSVQWIALMENQSKIADMIGALSDFLRFSLNKGNEFCKIEHEIEHVKNYVTIQNIRYPDKFDVDYIVNADVTNHYMLKLLLQPLVENAMIHGIQKLTGKGSITVCIEQKGNLIHYMVLDNGVGMSAERLEFVQQMLQSSMQDESSDEVYGLRNVNERLILHYGPDSRLHIKSSANQGTQIYFTTPIIGDKP